VTLISIGEVKQMIHNDREKPKNISASPGPLHSQQLEWNSQKIKSTKYTNMNKPK
jgi:hypothetical protein